MDETKQSRPITMVIRQSQPVGRLRKKKGGKGSGQRDKHHGSCCWLVGVSCPTMNRNSDRDVTSASWCQDDRNQWGMAPRGKPRHSEATCTANEDDDDDDDDA